MRCPEIHSADWAHLSEPPVFVSVSKAEMLRLLVKQEVHAASEETLELFDRLTAVYEEEVSRLRENERRTKLLEAVFNPRVQLHRSGLCFFIVVPGLRARFTGAVWQLDTSSLSWSICRFSHSSPPCPGIQHVAMAPLFTRIRC